MTPVHERVLAILELLNSPTGDWEQRWQTLGVLAALVLDRHARPSLRRRALCLASKPVAALSGATRNVLTLHGGSSPMGSQATHAPTGYVGA